MPTCAKCSQPYHEEYDGCPKCGPEERKALYSIKSNLTSVMILLALMFLVSLFAGCNTVLGSGI